MTITVSLRDATAADVDRVVALVESAYRGEVSRAGWTTEADLLAGRRTGADEIGPAVADPRTVVLLAEDAGELVGCCRLDDHGDGIAHFGTFAVLPTRQGSGVGRLVLEAAQQRAREAWGATVLEMTVLAQRPELIAYYERRGFRRTGESRPFPYGDERYGVPLRDDLRFEVLARPLA